MNRELGRRYAKRFYIEYLFYTALQTDMLFFVVCDVLFLTEVKGLSMEQVSLVTFLSLAFSLLVQYPLLKLINQIGNRASVRIGSIVFVLSALCITFSPGFAVVLVGGFLKCIAHTLSAMGSAVLKNQVIKDGLEDWFILYQSDANSTTSFLMMLTALLGIPLFHINAYLPMIACIAFCVTGVIVSFRITKEDEGTAEISSVNLLKEYIGKKRTGWNPVGAVLLISFAIFTTLTGTGLTNARMNIQEYFAGRGSDYIITLLGILSTVIYMIRILSNVVMRETYKKAGKNILIVVSVLMTTGLAFQILPWFSTAKCMPILLCAGYLLLAFVRDPYITLVQDLSLENREREKQQGILIGLNTAKKAGALFLSITATLILKYSNIIPVMEMLCMMSIVNIVLCLIFYNHSSAKGGNHEKEKNPKFSSGPGNPHGRFHIDVCM